MTGRAERLALTMLMGAMCCAPAQTLGTFTATGSMTTGRAAYSATLLLDGRVLMAGGNNHGNITDSAELYDPSKGNFTATGRMATSREYPTATLLPDGRVLIAG